VACYELHTFSSLDKNFLVQYEHKMNKADLAIVFYSPHTLEMRRLAMISPEDIKKAFGDENLMVFTDSQALRDFLMDQNWYQSNLLMMSSGTFGGMDLAKLSADVLAKEVVEAFPNVKIITEPKEDNSWSGLLSQFKKVFE
jgi:UDP-N-acetylmuramate: L-alanyl-gamma-D-glutamyl-meso-diaminopimelate ligase